MLSKANGNSVYKTKLELFFLFVLFFNSEHHSASMADVHSYATSQEECIVKYQFGWDKKKCSKRMIKVKSNLSFWPVIDAEKEDSKG